MLLQLPKRPAISSEMQVKKISKEVTLQSNLFLMQVEANLSSDSDEISAQLTHEIQCHQYDVVFDPQVEEDNRPLRYKIFKLARRMIENKIGKFNFSGKSLYSIKRLREQNIKEIEDIHQNVDGIQYKIKLRYTKSFSLNQDNASLQENKTANFKQGNQVTQAINIMLRDVIRSDLRYQEIGRNSKFFKTNEKTSIVIQDRNRGESVLECYKGFAFGTIPTRDKLYLMTDYASRILRKDTALDVMKKCCDRNEQEATINGQSVITEYNNYQIYKIEKIDFTKTPLSTFLNKATNEQITFKKYYKDRYNINILDDRQPLLHHIRKYRQPNTNIQKFEDVYLVPELCKMTGITDEMRSNFSVKNEIGAHTKLTPTQRFARSQNDCRLLADNVRESGLKIDFRQSTVKGIQLNAPQIYFGAQKSIIADKGNFDMRAPTLDKIVFEDWSIIYHYKDQTKVDQFIQTLTKASQAYGITVKEPFFFETKTNKSSDWINEIKKDLSKNDPPKFIVTFGAAQSNHYQDLKTFLTVEKGIQSQHINPKSLQKNGMSVASKIALQIASKLGKRTWGVEIPLGINPHTMIIGIETSMKTIKKSKVIGVVATVNKDFTKYFSDIDIRQENDVILPTLSTIISKAISSYANNCKTPPNEIIIYRQGLGEGQIQQSLNLEIQSILNGFTQYNKGYKPKFAFFQVNKKIGQKFYAQTPSSREPISNPNSGTIVAREVVQNNFEFFMAAQNCNSGVCTPTKYTCLYNDTSLTEDKFWQLTYYQTFNYSNWQGPVRVPAAMKYAEKLAKFASDILLNNASQQLSNTLYYL